MWCTRLRIRVGEEYSVVPVERSSVVLGCVCPRVGAITRWLKVDLTLNLAKELWPCANEWSGNGRRARGVSCPKTSSRFRMAVGRLVMFVNLGVRWVLQ